MCELNEPRDKYGPAMREAGQMSTEEIDKYAQSPEDAVAVVLLLDQIPRNIFRESEASEVSMYVY